MKIDWKRKLTSRKLWIAVAGLVSGLVIVLGCGENTATQISGTIMSLASVISYIVGEGFIDAKNKQPPAQSEGDGTDDPDTNGGVI